MGTIKTSDEVNHDRRRFIETAAGIAAAGTLSSLPERTAGATDKTRDAIGQSATPGN